MSSFKRIRVCICLLCASFLFPGYSPAQVLLGNDAIDSMNAYPVKGRNGWLLRQHLSFGPFSSGKVSRSWTPGRSISFGSGTADLTISKRWNDRKQTYSFHLVSENKDTVYITCAANIKEEELVFDKASHFLQSASGFLSLEVIRDHNLYIQITGTADSLGWQLLLDNNAADNKGDGYTGYLYAGDDRYYTISPVKTIRNKKGKAVAFFGIAGFLVREPSGNPVAAVSLIDNGIVYLDKNLDKNTSPLLAAVCAAVLLQQDINE